MIDTKIRTRYKDYLVEATPIFASDGRSVQSYTVEVFSGTHSLGTEKVTSLEYVPMMVAAIIVTSSSGVTCTK